MVLNLFTVHIKEKLFTAIEKLFHFNSTFNSTHHKRYKIPQNLLMNHNGLRVQ